MKPKGESPPRRDKPQNKKDSHQRHLQQTLLKQEPSAQQMNAVRRYKESEQRMMDGQS